MSPLSNIESILFVASKPLTAKKIAHALGKNVSEVEEALENLRLKYNREDSGIHLFFDGGNVRLGTNPANADAIDGFMKDEIAGELTRAQLETMTVIAYRGPVTRPELEQIRGVNCSVIVRNLMIRGLVEESDDADKLMPVYTLSLEALRHLGVSSVDELPEYEMLHSHDYIEKLLGKETEATE